MEVFRNVLAEKRGSLGGAIDSFSFPDKVAPHLPVTIQPMKMKELSPVHPGLIAPLK